ERHTVLGLLAPVAPQHRTEADGEALHAHAEEPRHHEMSQLVNDDENPDHDDEGHDRRHVAILPAARGAESASAGSHPATARRVSASTSTQVSISTSARAGTCARARSINCAISMKRIRPARKAATASSLAALSTTGATPPAWSARRASARQGNRSLSGASKVSAPTRVRSRRSAAAGRRDG